ncbi:Beta-secretase 2 [Dissophora ornata]|nr:Beta-secretase 2 [Dissophora ornata]
MPDNNHTPVTTVGSSSPGTNAKTKPSHHLGNGLVVTASDYGVIQLDLEGDPNCDYTTKVKIAGLEFNVIIDTGSAHFAVASSACRDCTIPRKDNYRLSEEEEIPIDADPELLDSSNLHASRPSEPEPLHLFKQDAKRIPTDSPSDILTPAYTFKPESLVRTAMETYSTTSLSWTSSTGSSLTTSSSIAPSATLTVSQATTSVAMTSLSTSSPTSSSATPLTSLLISRTASTVLSTLLSHTSTMAPALSFNDNIKAIFPDIKNRLEMMHSSLVAIRSPSVVSALRGSTTSASPTQSMANVNSYSAPVQTPGTKPFLAVFTNLGRINSANRAERQLAAAPTENLYPLSTSSRENGQTVRVSYGIKSHSVGWSGVMTSDLMTLEMAKVDPKNLLGQSAAASSPSLSASADGTNEVFKAGGVMEKETNVEFAAITENNEFFSPECGAQHGIWGLGYRTLSVDRKSTLFDTLSASMRIPNGFALQLCGRTSNTTKSGNMFLGGYSTAHLAEPMQFVPLVKKDWYQVRLDGFKVMGEPVEGMQNLNLPKAIVDSGTTNILMSHYNLQFLIRSLAQSSVVRWSGLIPDQDINSFWFRNAVLRLPRSSFQVSTAARAVEVVMSGVSIPIYTSSFLRIKPVPFGQAPDGYVDFWWHGFASSTSPDAIEAEGASGGAVMPGSVGTILGETLFAGKVVYFERGNENAQPGDPDFGRIGFGRGKNCFALANHSSVDVLANGGKVASAEAHGPVRVAATSEANAVKKGHGRGKDYGGSGSGSGSGSDTELAQPQSSSVPTGFQTHFHGLSGPIRLMGDAPRLLKGHGMMHRIAGGVFVAIIAAIL